MHQDTTSPPVLEVITDELVRLGAERDQVTGEAKLTDIDVDSLDLAELAQIVEERYGIQLTGTDVTSIQTVGDIATLIEARA
ncbi:MAG TPA: phosphopantetheine-binding protein [Solirubrobacteraceae bacterium]|jgi:acyl carrier protein|nr:phosphopantetheine-binding protein [Solirubrobacteraceae bacterium]